ncbi:MAG TPA: lysylphosphatidylglycerol synthase transmembrane domain-containing protein [Terriglobales bacterium]|nr:lysylphosphatidylglycerol synthase transmembrane domain-containing protein [Terriglobales bacterium]
MTAKEPSVLSKHRAKVWLTYVIAALALYWVFHDVHWGALVDQFKQLSWGWVSVIVFWDVLSFYVQGIRWQILLQPLGKLSYWRTTQAIYVGLLTSEILPLRAGEIIRGILVARWLGRKFHDVLPSMAVERMFDAFWFSGAMIATALLIDVPPQIRVGTNVMAAAAILGIIVFVYVVKKTHYAENVVDLNAEPKNLVEKLRFALFEIRVELKQIGLGRRFWTSGLVSGLLHVVQALAFLSILKACGVDLPLLASIAVFLVVHLGIAIPNAPANVGTFQLFCVLGLTFFGVEKSTAAAVSVIAFAILTFPVLLIGVLATLQAGFSLTSFHTQLRDMSTQQPAAERVI